MVALVSAPGGLGGSAGCTPVLPCRVASEACCNHPYRCPLLAVLLALCLQNPDLPADVFTACLTTPIKVALRWFCSKSLLRHDGEYHTPRGRGVQADITHTWCTRKLGALSIVPVSQVKRLMLVCKHAIAVAPQKCWALG